jgi:hypothetical protein
MSESVPQPKSWFILALRKSSGLGKLGEGSVKFRLQPQKGLGERLRLALGQVPVLSAASIVIVSPNVRQLLGTELNHFLVHYLGDSQLAFLRYSLTDSWGTDVLYLCNGEYECCG